MKKDNSSNENTLEYFLKVFNTDTSVERIRRSIKTNDKFSFQQLTEELKRKIVLNLGSFKGTSVADIPADMLKSNIDIRLSFTTKIINLSFVNNCFPDDLKLAEVSLVLKKVDDLDNDNYKPASVLSHLSKVLERIVYNQIDNFIKDKISNLLTDFRKSHSTQHCLMCMLESGRADWVENFMFV